MVYLSRVVSMLIINFSIIVIILLIEINSISSHYTAILIILIVKWALQAIITTVIHQTSTPTIHQPTQTSTLALTLTLIIYIINPNIPLYLIIIIIITINLMKFQCHPSNNTANTNTMMIVLHSLWILMLWVMILEGFWLTPKIRSNYVDYWVLKLIQAIKTYNNIIIITTIV